MTVVENKADIVRRREEVYALNLALFRETNASVTAIRP